MNIKNKPPAEFQGPMFYYNRMQPMKVSGDDPFKDLEVDDLEGAARAEVHLGVQVDGDLRHVHRHTS